MNSQSRSTSCFREPLPPPGTPSCFARRCAARAAAVSREAAGKRDFSPLVGRAGYLEVLVGPLVRVVEELRVERVELLGQRAVLHRRRALQRRGPRARVPHGAKARRRRRRAGSARRRLLACGLVWRAEPVHDGVDHGPHAIHKPGLTSREPAGAANSVRGATVEVLVRRGGDASLRPSLFDSFG